MSAAEFEAAIDRVVRTHDALGRDDFAAYAVLVMSILAQQAPEVLTFLLDRADEKLGGGAATTPTYGMCIGCGSIEVALVEATGKRDLSAIGESSEYPTGYGCEVCS